MGVMLANVIAKATRSVAKLDLVFVDFMRVTTQRPCHPARKRRRASCVTPSSRTRQISHADGDSFADDRDMRVTTGDNEETARLTAC